MKVLEKLKIVEKVKNNANFKILILKQKSLKNSFDGKILGRELHKWVAFACCNHDINIVDFDGKNILEFIKNKLDKKYTYTIVLPSIIPLITSNTIENIKEYAIYKDISLCKLPVGYVVKNNIKNMLVDSVYSQNIDDFYMVENKKQFTYALSVLQDRINSFHINNGVEFIDPKKVYIEPDVDIASDVIIYPGNSLKGMTIINKGVILKENNVIDNSKIGLESCISSSIINKSVIGKYVGISPFCEIENSLIGDETIIGSKSIIKNYKIDGKSNIKIGAILGEDK